MRKAQTNACVFNTLYLHLSNHLLWKKEWKLINCRSSFPLTPNIQEYELPANQYVWLSSKSEWSKQANQCFLLLHGTVDKGVSTSPLEVMWCLLSCCLKGTSAEVALRSSQLTILRLLSSVSQHASISHTPNPTDFAVCQFHLDISRRVFIHDRRICDLIVFPRHPH